MRSKGRSHSPRPARSFRSFRRASRPAAPRRRLAFSSLNIAIPRHGLGAPASQTPTAFFSKHFALQFLLSAILKSHTGSDERRFGVFRADRRILRSDRADW
jgi:hypothetical protein